MGHHFSGESLGTHELNPYLKGIGSDYSNGVNFAMAGSTVTHGVSPYSLNVQVDQFVYFRHRSLEMFERGLLPLPSHSHSHLDDDDDDEIPEYSILNLKKCAFIRTEKPGEQGGV